MGLIRLADTAFGAIGAGINAVDGSLSSMMYKEYFTSGDMSGGILMKRAEKVLTDRGKNKKADDNLISSGSGIDVQEGQCMIIVDNGAVVEFCAEPGRYTYDKSTQPSLFGGGNNGLKAFGREILNQWSTGGQRFSTQRVYFINMNEQIFAPIKWGCGDIPFHHTTLMKNGAPPIELDVTLKGNGELTIKISDPMLFFKNIGAQRVGGDNDGVVSVNDPNISSNLKSGIIDKIGEAISTLSTDESIPWTALKKHSSEISKYINKLLSDEWAGKRGFEVCSFTANTYIIGDEDREMLNQMVQSFNMGANTNAAIYDIQKGYSEGARAAGANPNGAANAFMGMGMAGMVGGFGQNMGQMQPTPNAYQTQRQQPQSPVPEAPIAPPAKDKDKNEWICECGTKNTANFCYNCGKKKPAPEEGWVCSCGSHNEARNNFCPVCGTKKTEKKKIKCDKCGWEAPDGSTPKFCPNCGDPINESDLI